MPADEKGDLSHEEKAYEIPSPADRDTHPEQDWTYEEEREIVKKADWRVFPMLCKFRGFQELFVCMLIPMRVKALCLVFLCWIGQTSPLRTSLVWPETCNLQAKDTTSRCWSSSLVCNTICVELRADMARLLHIRTSFELCHPPTGCQTMAVLSHRGVGRLCAGHGFCPRLGGAHCSACVFRCFRGWP